MAPGVVLSVEPESVVILEKMSAEIKNGELQNREALVNSESGLVVMNIAPWNKEKTDVRVKTTEGESVAQGTVYTVSFMGGKMMTTVTRGSVGSRDSSGKMVSIAAGQQAAPGATPVAAPANSPAVTAAGKAVESTVSAMVANVAASIAAAIPTAAAEVAAIATKAAPAAAEQIAGAVAAKAPEAAIAIAQAVSKAAPEAAAKVAAAVIAATPGLDSKSISAITTASSQGAADAPSVDTAAGNAGGVGAGSGSVGQGMAATQFQQLQAEQNKERTAQAAQDAAQAAADKLKAAADEVRRLQDALAAAKEADKQRLREQLANAILALDQAKSNNEKAQLDLASGQARKDATAAASAAAAEKLNNVTPENATSVVAALVSEAAGVANSTKGAQETVAGELVILQTAEAEKVAEAAAAAEVARAAANLATKIASAKTQADLQAAAVAAVTDAKALADLAEQKAIDTGNAANLAKSEASTFILPTIRNEADQYMDSKPAFGGNIDVTTVATTSARSIKAIFTDAQLDANSGALRKFIDKWDIYINKEREKYAAAAEYKTKDDAYKAVDLLKTTIMGSSFESAKTAANAKLLELQQDALDAADAAALAEAAALAKAKLEAAARAAREVAAAAKAAAEKLAEDILADVSKAAQLAADLKSQLSTEAGVAQGALTGLDTAATEANAAALQAIADAEAASTKVPVAEGGSRPSYATDVGTDL